MPRKTRVRFNADDLVVVTGGAGFIGSNVCKHLCEAGVRVVVCDRLGSGEKWKNISGLWLEDIIRPETLTEYLSLRSDRIAAIVHMGAISSTTESDVDRLVRDNIHATLDLYDWSSRNGSRLVYASSAATYGNGGLGFKDVLDINYLAALRPLNAYGWSKSVVDIRFAKDKLDGKDINNVVGLKFFNVFGPGENHKGEMRSVVNKIIPRIYNGEVVNLFKSYDPAYENGGQKRDFVYVDDCVDIIDWLLSSSSVSGIFNVGSGVARTFNDLALATFMSLDRTPQISYIEMPEAIRQKYQYFTQADMSSAQKAGYDGHPTKLEDGVKAYVEDWLRSR